jgi:hypothetical protein
LHVGTHTAVLPPLPAAQRHTVTHTCCCMQKTLAPAHSFAHGLWPQRQAPGRRCMWCMCCLTSTHRGACGACAACAARCPPTEVAAVAGLQSAPPLLPQGQWGAFGLSGSTHCSQGPSPGEAGPGRSSQPLTAAAAVVDGMRPHTAPSNIWWAGVKATDCWKPPQPTGALPWWQGMTCMPLCCGVTAQAATACSTCPTRVQCDWLEGKRCAHAGSSSAAWHEAGTPPPSRPPPPPPTFLRH